MRIGEQGVHVQHLEDRRRRTLTAQTNTCMSHRPLSAKFTGNRIHRYLTSNQMSFCDQRGLVETESIHL